jgi:hypothetical protein
MSRVVDVIGQTVLVSVTIAGFAFSAGFAAYTLAGLVRAGWRYARWCFTE